MKTLATRYSKFTPDEWVRLTLAAFERKDVPEVDRLMGSCPQETRVFSDPRYRGRLACLRDAVYAEIIRWMEVSANIMATIASMPDEDGAPKAEIDATWKTYSTYWRGVESGIAKFCADVGLTCDQLLALADGRPTTVERAGRALHPRARASGRAERAVRERLWHAWRVGSQM